MKVNEKQLDYLVKHYLVREYKEWGIDGMCIKKFLPLCAALLYPYKNDTIEKESNLRGTIMPIFESVKTFSKKIRGLDKYSLEGLRRYFQRNWLPTLDSIQQVRLIRGISLITDVEDNGFFSINGNEKVHEAFLNTTILDISNNYGKETYVEERESMPQAERIENEPDGHEDKYKLEEVTSQLDSHWRTIFNKEEFKKYMPLVWKLDISQSDYIKIKRLLALFIKALPKKSRERNSYLYKYADWFFVYVALWYRWDYNGRGKNALEEINYPLRADSIWDNCTKSYNKYLVESEDRNTSWLYSLYVLGGFPLKYVCSAESRFSRLFKEINNPEMNEDEDLLEKISESFDNNNSVYYRSLIDGSFKAYVSDLTNGERHIAQEDYSLEIVKHFIEFLEKGKINYYNDFFKINWYFYIESSKSDCILNLNIGTKDNRCYIPEEPLRHAEVLDVEDLKDFYLYIDYNKGEKFSKLLRFSRTAGKGSPFVGWGNSNVIHFPVIPKVGDSISIKIVNLYDVDKEHPYTLKEFPVDGYFRLFKTYNPYEWSSLTNNKTHSILLFSPFHYSLVSSDDRINNVIVGSYRWLLHNLYDDAQLEDIHTHNRIDFKIRKGILSIEFKKQPSIIQYNSKNEISYSYYVDDDILNESLPLMLGMDGISKVFFNPFKQGESPKTLKPGKDKDLIIKYKQNTFNYRSFDDEAPHTGIMSLSVSYENHSVVKKCFYISNPSFVERDLDNSQFVFRLSDAEVFQTEDEKLECHIGIDSIIFDENKDYLPHKDYLTFSVGTKTDFANINVYRARECRELYFDEHRFTEFGNPNVPSKIPFILREKFRIRTIDRDGVKNVPCPHNIWMNPVVNLQIIDERTQNNNIKNDNENGIVYYQYVSKETSPAELGHYHISSKAFYKYKFFHWNMRSNGIPTPVETEYISDNEELIVKYNELDDSSIVFQSLRDEQPYNYVRPIIPNISIKNRIFGLNFILNCIEVATEHKVYFSMFYPIRKWVEKQCDLFDIFEGVCKRKSFTLKTEDYENLHRFAHEFCFEWILLSRSRWKRLHKKEQYREIIEVLFRTTPFACEEKEWMERVIELYFIDLNMDFRRDNQTVAGLVLQCMRCKDGDKQFFKGDDYNIRISRLESIYKYKDSICYQLYQKLNEQQKNK